MLNYTFEQGEGGRDPIKLIGNLEIKIYLNQISGQVLTLKKDNFVDYIYRDTPNPIVAFSVTFFGGLLVAVCCTEAFRKVSGDVKAFRKRERDELAE